MSRTSNFNQLLAYYPLSETGHNTVSDQSNFQRTAALGSGTYWDYEGRGNQFTGGQ